MCYKLIGAEAERLRIYLDEWAATHHKYKSLSDWVAGLSAWTKELQVYSCLAMLEQSLEAWTQHCEPDDTFKRYFTSAQTLPDIAELGRAWLKSERPRGQIEQEFFWLKVNIGMRCDTFHYTMDEYNPGPPDVRRFREHGLAGIEAFLKFCATVTWSEETVRRSTTDIREMGARASAGPVEESTRCIMYQIQAMGMEQREGKGRLIEHLSALLG